LRRTNAGDRCAACLARTHQEHPIPQRFWYADDVAAALAQWDLPAVVQLVHRKLGLTQIALANLTGYSQAHISRWLRHDGNPEGVTALRLRQFVEGLAIPWELLGLIDPALRGSSPQLTRGNFGNGTVAEEDHQAMKRRTFVLSGTFAAGLAAFAPEGSGMWQGKLGAVHARYLHEAARHLIEQNFRFGGDMLFGQAAAQFEVAHGKIRAGDYDTTAEPALFAALGELARCAGWIAHDAGREREARYYFNEALLAARLSDNPQLALKAYYSMSVQADEEGHPREAVHLLHAAQRAARTWAPGRILSLLANAEARAAAGMQESDRARSLLSKARHLFHTGHGGDHDDIFSFYNEAEILGFAGICHLKLGAHADAEGLLRQEIAQHAVQRGADYQRNTTLEYGRLALAQLGQSNVTEAALTGRTVLSTLADGVVSTRTLNVVRSVADGLSAYRTLPPVRSFLKHFRDATSEIGGPKP
jgi:transcriptional regulator with XRE-family HTH domain